MRIRHITRQLIEFGTANGTHRRTGKGYWRTAVVASTVVMLVLLQGIVHGMARWGLERREAGGEGDVEERLRREGEELVVRFKEERAEVGGAGWRVHRLKRA